MAQISGGHVFISYSRKDKAVMQRIAELLHGRGINVWVDNEELVPGTPIWEEGIEKAIRGAFAMIVLLSPDSKNSIWVRREISFAEQYNKRMFPVLVRGGEKASISIRLITSQYVDIRQNEAAGLDALVTELMRVRTEPNASGELDGEELSEPAPEKAERHRVKIILTWAAHHRVLVATLAGTFIVLALALWFAAGVIRNSQTILPVATTSTLATALQPVSDILTPNCRPSGNQPPSIHLNLVPRSVKINLTAELTISVSDPENDAYEILLVTAEKGEFPNGKEEPYLYVAPGSPDKDIITVWVGDHECQTKEEITITITQ